MDLVDVQRFKECNGFAFPGSRTTAQLLQRANSNGEACPTLVEWSNAVYRWRDLRWETLNRGNANNFFRQPLLRPLCPCCSDAPRQPCASCCFLSPACSHRLSWGRLQPCQCGLRYDSALGHQRCIDSKSENSDGEPL